MSNDQLGLPGIKPDRSEYKAYDKLGSFWLGYNSHMDGTHARSPYRKDSADAQAFDKGVEFAMRLKLWKAAQDQGVP
jgi:hypothetical protein